MDAAEGERGEVELARGCVLLREGGGGKGGEERRENGEGGRGGVGSCVLEIVLIESVKEVNESG